jgi:fructose-1-phosphate kinase PfkB-like protein
LGSILLNAKKNQIHFSPAYADTVTDKVGALDAMLAILSVCLSQKVDPDLSLLIYSLL